MIGLSSEAEARALRVNARLERMFFPNGLSLEDRVRMAVRAAKAELEPHYVEALRHIDPGVKIAGAFELWRFAWGMLYSQALQRGLSPEEAVHFAAQQLLATHNQT